MKKQEEELQWVTANLVSAQKRGWFGKITVEFKNGMIDIVRSEETMKPPNKQNG